MSLLELDCVSKSYRHGAAMRRALNGVSLQIERGELLAVWGQPRSGRSTLLRVAAALERPDEGSVRFDGCVLDGRASDRARAGGLRYCRRTFRPTDGRSVHDQLVSAQELLGVHQPVASSRAYGVLEHVGVGPQSAALRPDELTQTELVLVSVGRALLRRPRLLVIDEPAVGVDLLERDRILTLLRRIADEGVGVLMSVGVTTELSGADRAVLIGGGELHGEPTVPELAPVVHLEDLARRRTA